MIYLLYLCSLTFVFKKAKAQEMILFHPKLMLNIFWSYWFNTKLVCFFGEIPSFSYSYLQLLLL